jgi:glycosyltransferase involved in cell wall biosynthesis
MHILLIHQAFAALDEAGGTRHYEIAAHLVKKGHQVSIIASPISYLSGKNGASQPKKQISDDITIYRTYTYPALHKNFIHRVISFISFMTSSFLKGLQIRHLDLIWGTSPPIFQAFSAWLISRLKGVPFLLEIRDLWPAFAIEVGVLKNPILIRLSLWLESFLYRHANVVVVNSPGYIAHVKSKGAQYVEMVPNGADATMFDPSDSGNTFRRQNNFQRKFLVVYAGAHGISNDLGVILEAANRLIHQPNIHFILVGDGKEKSNLQSQANRLQLTNVSFLEPVPKQQMAEVLAASDSCIAILKPLELYKITYPNKVFDYMAAGRPILLVIDGEIRQVVEKAKCGLFVTPGDAKQLSEKVLWLMNHKEESKNMGLAGRKYLEKHFNRQELSDQFIRIINKLQEKSGR